ncbi:hypothetical protein SPI_01332 [Niveomyces insectorum RCEF 264]|uniref:DUF4440 domain-containing protein n=1 Tax=Niveomyces insectorum RCEF 264 TaxID=1081102 RepID=A0A167YVV1_9HYPO|nr:hypothetical protein SPI_01332 [Niveomyces insectorum RCEF 264]
MPTVLGLTNEPHERIADMSTQDVGPDNKGRLSTILQRNVAAGRAMDTQLWRALCDEPASAAAYMAQDVVVSTPLIPTEDNDKHDGESPAVLVAGKDDVEAALAKMPPLAGYKIRGTMKVVQIDLMAVATVYRVTASRRVPAPPPSSSGQRRANDQIEDLEMVVHSSWRQTAGADWELCGHCAGFAE